MLTDFLRNTMLWIVNVPPRVQVVKSLFPGELQQGGRGALKRCKPAKEFKHCGTPACGEAVSHCKGLGSVKKKNCLVTGQKQQGQPF